MRPYNDYVYGKAIVKETGVMTSTSVEETQQRYKVISVGEGRFESGILVTPTVKPGDVVIIQKHAAEGDTPPEMLDQGYALFMASRIMAVEEE